MTSIKRSSISDAPSSAGAMFSGYVRRTKGSDVLSGREGTHWIDGRGGNDVIRGGPGDENPLTSRAIGSLDGGPGADVISGGPGRDYLIDGPWPVGDSAVDVLEGGDGS